MTSRLAPLFSPQRLFGGRRPSLFWQIAALCGAMITLTILGTWIAADTLAGHFKTVLSQRYGVEAGIAQDMFMDSLHQSLLIAAVMGTGASLMAGALFVPRILAPFRDMARKADLVAQGDFTVRVDLERVPQRCEVHALGSAFNRMASQLMRLDFARKRMIADLSHDLLSPLANLRGYVEGLRDNVITATPPVLAMLEGEIGRLIRLVGDLHELTIAESARNFLRMAPVDISTVFANGATFIARAAVEKGVTIETDVDANVPTILGDPDALARVMQNLLLNAVRHADAGSIVRLAAEAREGWIELRCTNQGAEIASADLPFLFDRFFRADPARSREGGAGIGLAIVKELIEAHGGEVSALSHNRRTEFIMRLPHRTVTQS